MQFYDLAIIAVSLSMDAFAVSICKGDVYKRQEMNPRAILNRPILCGQHPKAP